MRRKLCKSYLNLVHNLSVVSTILMKTFLLPFQTSDDKDKANSPFESNGLKKEEVNSTNGVVIVNGIDDDKGFK